MPGFFFFSVLAERCPAPWHASLWQPTPKKRAISALQAGKAARFSGGAPKTPVVLSVVYKGVCCRMAGLSALHGNTHHATLVPRQRNVPSTARGVHRPVARRFDGASSTRASPVPKHDNTSPSYGIHHCAAVSSVHQADIASASAAATSCSTSQGQQAPPTCPSSSTPRQPQTTAPEGQNCAYRAPSKGNAKHALCISRSACQTVASTLSQHHR